MIAFAIILVPFVILSTAQLFGWKWPLEFTGANIIMAVILTIFVILLVIAAFGQKFRLKRLGSYILHLGFILFLLGSLLFTLTGQSLTVAVPVDNTMAYKYLEDADGNTVELGFGFGLDEFQIKYYDPVYDVYKMTDDGPVAVMTDIQLQRAANGDWYYDFEDYGAIGLDDLLGGKTIDTIKETVTLASGVIASVRLPVKEYVAKMTFIDNSNGSMETKELRVNAPLYRNGFKIYLMGYNEMTSRVTLMFKNDIGEPLATAGLVAVMLGTFYQCIIYPIVERREREKNDTAPATDKKQGEGR